MVEGRRKDPEGMWSWPSRMREREREREREKYGGQTSCGGRGGGKMVKWERGQSVKIVVLSSSSSSLVRIGC